MLNVYHLEFSSKIWQVAVWQIPLPGHNSADFRASTQFLPKHDPDHLTHHNRAIILP